MRKILLRRICLLLLPLTLFSCSKEEGKGGQATLTGKVFIKEVDNNTKETISEYAAIDQRVFIKYGDNDIHDDDFRTNEKGEYKFEGLRTGDYSIQTYYLCDDCIEPTSIVEQQVTISDSKGTTSAPDIYLENNSISDGAVSIVGNAFFKDTIPVQQKVRTSIAVDQRIYLVYNNETVYREDFRTDNNGLYRFDNLKAGKYTVYSYICDNCIDDIVTSELEFTIDINSGEFTPPNLYIKTYQIP